MDSFALGLTRIAVPSLTAARDNLPSYLELASKPSPTSLKNTREARARAARENSRSLSLPVHELFHRETDVLPVPSRSDSPSRGPGIFTRPSQVRVRAGARSR